MKSWEVAAKNPNSLSELLVSEQCFAKVSKPHHVTLRSKMSIKIAKKTKKSKKTRGSLISFLSDKLDRPYNESCWCDT